MHFIHSNGSHEIVIDEVAEEGVHLRDPYHGWAIIVSHQSFRKYTHFPLKLIPIKKFNSFTPQQIENQFEKRLNTITDSEVQAKLARQLSYSIQQMTRNKESRWQKVRRDACNLDALTRKITWTRDEQQTPL